MPRRTTLVEAKPSGLRRWKRRCSSFVTVSPAPAFRGVSSVELPLRTALGRPQKRFEQMDRLISRPSPAAYDSGKSRSKRGLEAGCPDEPCEGRRSQMKAWLIIVLVPSVLVVQPPTLGPTTTPAGLLPAIAVGFSAPVLAPMCPANGAGLRRLYLSAPDGPTIDASATATQRRMVKHAHRSKTVKSPYTINRMIELEKTAGAYADQIRPLSSISPNVINQWFAERW